MYSPALTATGPSLDKFATSLYHDYIALMAICRPLSSMMLIGCYQLAFALNGTEMTLTERVRTQADIRTCTRNLRHSLDSMMGYISSAVEIVPLPDLDSWIGAHSSALNVHGSDIHASALMEFHFPADSREAHRMIDPGLVA